MVERDRKNIECRDVIPTASRCLLVCHVEIFTIDVVVAIERLGAFTMRTALLFQASEGPIEFFFIAKA